MRQTGVAPKREPRRGEEGGERRKPAPGKVCCEMRVEFLVTAEQGGREQGSRKGSEVKLNKTRVGRGAGWGNWAHFSGWKSKAGEEMGSGSRVEREDGGHVRTPLQPPAVCDLGVVA